MLSNESNKSDEVNNNAQSTEFNNNDQSTSSAAEEPGWDSQRMNTLAGFEDNTAAARTTEDTADDSESLLPEEDPYSLRTEQTFQNHPFSKLGLVSLGTLALVLAAGVFLSANVMQSQGQKPREQQVNPIARENQDDAEATDSQGRVLTDLALTTQGKDLEALNEKDKQHSIPQQAAKPSSKPTAPKTSRASARAYSPAPRPRPVAAYSPSRPVAAYSPPRTYSPPRAIPKPVVQPSPVVQPRSVDSAASAEEVNPMERWIAAAQLGSHGQFSASEETTTDVETTTEVDTASQQTPVEYAALTVSAKSKQQPEPQTPTVNFDEEAPILQEQPRQLLLPGTGAKAVLATPFAWDGSEDTQSDLLSVVLAEPLLAADGTVALPAKTQLLVEARSLSESGLVRLVALSAIVKLDGQQYEVTLPENAIGIRGSEGKPLIAQKLNDKRREIRRRDATRFAIGAIGRAAGLINRPRSESVASNSGGFSRSTTQNDEPNLIAGILEGGSEAILDDIDERNEEAISAIEQRPDVLFLKAGTKVEVFVNQSAAIDVLLGDQPILESQQPETEQFALADSNTFSAYLWEPEAPQFISPVTEERRAIAWLDAE